MAAGWAANVTKGLVVSFTIDPHVMPPSCHLPPTSCHIPVATCVPANAT